MPWTVLQTRYLLSSGSPLTHAQKEKMLSELHDNPALGHAQKKPASPLAAKWAKRKKSLRDSQMSTMGGMS